MAAILIRIKHLPLFIEIAPTDHLVGKVWEEKAFGESPQFVTMFFGKNVTESTKRNKLIDNCR